MKNIKKLLIFFSFVLTVQFTLQAQDKIITTRQDTIICRIVSVSGNHIVYEQKVDGKQVVGKTISMDEVGEYYHTPQTADANIAGQRNFGVPEKPWLLSVSAGGAYLPWLLENVKEENIETDSYKKISKGFALNANIHCLITDFVGAGVQYSFFTSGYKDSYSSMISPDYPIYSNANIRERQYMHYAGISFIFRQFLDRSRKFSLNETLSGGLLFYRYEMQKSLFLPIPAISGYSSDISENALVTGKTFGATFGLSTEYKIFPYLSVGIGGNFMYGDLSKANSEYKNSWGEHKITPNQDIQSPINLSRIDYFLVLRFNL